MRPLRLREGPRLIGASEEQGQCREWKLSHLASISYADGIGAGLAIDGMKRLATTTRGGVKPHNDAAVVVPQKGEASHGTDWH